jgi:hypothetical protein
LQVVSNSAEVEKLKDFHCHNSLHSLRLQIREARFLRFIAVIQCGLGAATYRGDDNLGLAQELR